MYSIIVDVVCTATQGESFAECLLTVEEPLAEGNYFSGLNDYTAEPPETLAIVRSNASEVLENCETAEYGPIIPEDRVFVEVELKIQKYAAARASRDRTEWVSTMAYWALALGVAGAGLIWGERALWSEVVVGGLVIVAGVLSWVFYTYRLVKREKIISRFTTALDKILGQ